MVGSGRKEGRDTNLNGSHRSNGQDFLTAAKLVRVEQLLQKT
jgi:hypothetical protein